MKRRWNGSIWAGFLIVWIGLLSYASFFVLFPVTRDFPWVNLLLFVLGGVLLVRGLARAFRQPDIYRGKVFGSILAGISAAAVGLFCFGVFVWLRQLPEPSGAPAVWEKAPEFSLADQNGQPITLAGLLKPSNAKPAKGALLIFYRGFW